MKQLEESFTNSHGSFELMERQGDYAVYRVIAGRSVIPTFELIRIRHQKAGERMIAGKLVCYEEKELYPRSQDWETYGWTFHCIEHALDRLAVQPGIDEKRVLTRKQCQDSGAVK